jgi:hypothetical protein
MKARALAEALDGRVTGDADAEIARAVHPAEVACERDIAIAISRDTVRLLGACRAHTVLVLEGTELRHGGLGRQSSCGAHVPTCP